MDSSINELSQEISNTGIEITRLKNLITSQNKMIINLLDEQHNMLQLILNNNRSKYGTPEKTQLQNAASLFPITTQEDLDYIEASINDDNEMAIVATISKIIQSGGLSKNLTRILSKDLILDYNIGGYATKKRLSTYENLLRVMHKAVGVDQMSYKQFLSQMRLAFKRTKNNHFKLVHIERKKMREEENDVHQALIAKEPSEDIEQIYF